MYFAQVFAFLLKFYGTFAAFRLTLLATHFSCETFNCNNQLVFVFRKVHSQYAHAQYKVSYTLHLLMSAAATAVLLTC